MEGFEPTLERELKRAIAQSVAVIVVISGKLPEDLLESKAS